LKRRRKIEKIKNTIGTSGAYGTKRKSKILDGIYRKEKQNSDGIPNPGRNRQDQIKTVLEPKKCLQKRLIFASFKP
jgi:hypothetical protein